MCSIIGYYGSGKAAPIMVSGLKSRMEYRGYDSVGIATKVENAVQIRKGVGRVDEVNKAENLDGLEGTVGIFNLCWGMGIDLDSCWFGFCGNRFGFVYLCLICLYWWRLFCFFFDLFEHFFHG